MTRPAVTSALGVFLMLGSSTSAQLAVRGEVVHTMAGPAIQDGVVLLKDGKIAAVGPAAEVQIPKSYRVMSAKVVTPGLIDAHSTVGLTGLLNQAQDQDQLERSEPIQPELRAIDAYNPQDDLVRWLREFGVTTIHTGHAPGLPMSGQTMIAKTTGGTTQEAVRVPTAMVAVTLGRGAVNQVQGEQPSPGTRAKVVSLIRAALVQAQEYLRKRETLEEDKKPGRDLRLEILAQVLRREIPLLVTAHKAHDIMSALRLAREFDLRVVLDGAAEAHLVLDHIAAAGVAVIVHPSMSRPHGETKNVSMETAMKLRQKGIPFALQSGYESYVPKTRVVLFEAGVAAAYGLSFEEALSAVTMDAAKILGVERFVGSLEVGKDGDLALYDGDPFEYTTHCVGAIIDGRPVSEAIR